MNLLCEKYVSLIAFIAVVLIWEGACRLFKVPGFILPSPSAIALAAYNVGLARWTEHVVATLSIAISGFITAMVIALPLAAAIARSRLMSRLIMPWLIVVQSTPVVAIAPIIVVTLGAGMLPRVVITTVIAFFPIVISTATGLKSVPEEVIELSKTLRAGSSREFWHIRMPYALPYFFSALRVAVTLSIIGAVVAEFVAAEKGLGYMILYSTSSFKVAAAFASLFILVLSSLAMYGSVVFIQKKFFPWSVGEST